MANEDNKVILVHILNKVDKLEEHVSAVRVDQGEIKLDLRYHVKRTNLLEEKINQNSVALSILTAPYRFVMGILKFLKLVK